MPRARKILLVAVYEVPGVNSLEAQGGQSLRGERHEQSMAPVAAASGTGAVMHSPVELSPLGFSINTYFDSLRHLCG